MNALAKQQWAPVKYTSTQLGGTSSGGVFYPGGLDLTTPSLRLQPGVLHDVINFECAQQGGYSRIDGYERFDGHRSPSSATFVIVQLSTAAPPGDDFTSDFNSDFGGAATYSNEWTTDFSIDFGGGGVIPVYAVNFPPVGSCVTQDNTGAVGYVIAVVEGPPAYLVLTKVTGSFDEFSVVRLMGTAGGGDFSADFSPDFTNGSGLTAVGYAAPFTATVEPRLLAIYLSLAADAYRASIGPVPGSGPVRGVVGMVIGGFDEVFAFRDVPNGSETVLWKASASGWVSVPFGHVVGFTGGGNTVPADGEVLTQGGVTATISRVMLQSGAWVGSTAVGQFAISAPSGGNFAAGAATTTSGVSVTLSGVQTAVTLAAGGRFEFVKGNFKGQASSRRIYGVDGVNKLFEFDGVTLTPIPTGLTDDSPEHIAFHKNYLFISKGSSFFHCAVGLPFVWDATVGAGEFAAGDIVNGMLSLPGEQTTAALSVFTESNFQILYGLDPTTFNLVSFVPTIVGAAPYSLQNMFDTFVLDDLGVVTVKTSLNYGNFTPSTLTKNILPFIQQSRGKLTASSVNREKSQYRLYFRDGYALYLSVLNQQYLGSTVVSYLNPINCTDTVHRTDSSEVTYAGALSSGFVYQLDIGTSFDGGDIDAYFTTAWDPVKSPRILKRFRAASLEVQGDSYMEIFYGYELGYANPLIAQPLSTPREVPISGARHWDSGFTWDSGISWDGNNLTPSDFAEIGTAENVRMAIASGTNYMAAYTVNSVIHHYSMRRGMRV